MGKNTIERIQSFLSDKKGKEYINGSQEVNGAKALLDEFNKFCEVIKSKLGAECRCDKKDYICTRLLRRFRFQPLPVSLRRVWELALSSGISYVASRYI